MSPFTPRDAERFRGGVHAQLHDLLGSHPEPGGVRFAVWAPNAESVSVIGSFNDWVAGAHPLTPRDDGSGIWEGRVATARSGDLYKYRLLAKGGGVTLDRGDPCARAFEAPPGSASRIWDLAYAWEDADWLRQRAARNAPEAPQAVYEVHLGSWRRRVAETGSERMTYRELAPALAEYAAEAGFTHVQLLPVMEHPDDASLGYQASGFFAPTARHGVPEDFMYLVDVLHRAGLAVLLAWSPLLAGGAGGLLGYDGTALYEGPAGPSGAGTLDLERGEVRSFLRSCAHFWLETYHVDGLCLGPLSALQGTLGGPSTRSPDQAIHPLQDLSEEVHSAHPGVLLSASGARGWSGVTRPHGEGGLGFDLSWHEPWAEHTLQYLGSDPWARHHAHRDLVALLTEAYTENGVLPLSHDHARPRGEEPGESSLLARMPGDEWQKRAALRLLLGYQYACPGKKLLFMGGELAQWHRWRPEQSLDWHLLAQPRHQRVRDWLRDLNHHYRRLPALYQRDFTRDGLEWVDFGDVDAGIVAFLRHGNDSGQPVLVVCNFNPAPRDALRLGVPRAGSWREVLNSDAELYGGSGRGNFGGVEAHPVPAHGHFQSLVLDLPPLGVLYLQPET